MTLIRITDGKPLVCSAVYKYTEIIELECGCFIPLDEESANNVHYCSNWNSSESRIKTDI